MKSVEQWQDDCLDNLEEAVRTLQEWVARGMSDEAIARRLESQAKMIAIFTGCSTFENISITWRTKFGLSWRELLDIAVPLLEKCRSWYDRGYRMVEFEYGNKGCRPALNLSRQYPGSTMFIGTWVCLDRMVAVWCRVGVIEEPPEVETTEVTK